MSDIIELRPKTAASGVIETPTHEEIMFVLGDCHTHGNLGVIRGGVGIGKTFAFEQYIATHQCNAAKATLDPSTGSMSKGLAEICSQVAGVWEWYFDKEAGNPEYPTSSPYIAKRKLQRLCSDIAERDGRLLLIIDEAQHARWELLEVLRAIYDKGLMSLVIAGNEQLFRCGKMADADFNALLSRAPHAIDRPVPLQEDVDAILQHCRINGTEARKLLSHQAAAGGLRKTFQIIEKARELSDGAPPSLQQLKAAAASTGLIATGWGRSR